MQPSVLCAPVLRPHNPEPKSRSDNAFELWRLAAASSLVMVMDPMVEVQIHTQVPVVRMAGV